MTKINYCLLSQVSDHIPLIKSLLSAKNDFTLYVFSEKDRLQIGELFSPIVDIKIVPLVNVASKKNWEIICSYVDVISGKRNFFYKVGFKDKVPLNVLNRYLSLSSLRHEVARMSALDEYIMSNKVHNMVVCSRYIDSRIQEFIPSRPCSFLLCKSGLFKVAKRSMIFVKRIYKVRISVLELLKSLQPYSMFSSRTEGSLVSKKPRNASFLEEELDEKRNCRLRNVLSSDENVDLNVYFYDLRPNYLVSKLTYLLPVMKTFLEKGKRVRLIVEGRGASKEAKDEAEAICNDFLGERSLFSCVYSSGNSLKSLLKISLAGLIISKWSHLSLARQHALRTSVSFEDLVLKYPAKNWLGLIDSYQLTMIKEAVKKFQLASTVGAIQYGTPDYTQLAYRYFQSDILFTYDRPSSAIYNSLNVGSACVESGSLETESLLKGLSREEEARVVVVFFDQPILQREDFDQNLVDNTYKFLFQVSKLKNVDVLIKCHPRRPKDSLPIQLQESSAQFIEGEDLGQVFMRSTFSISFTSSLLDVAAYAGSLPISIGGDRYYSKGQKTSFELVGGIISEDFNQLEKTISLSAINAEYKDKLTYKTKKIHNSYCSQLKPSEIIYNTFTNC